MEEPGAPIRLREAGVGVVLGGIVLILLGETITPGGGAIATIVCGAGYAMVGPSVIDPRRIGLGIALVGMIALVEASQFGLGYRPLVIGLFAIALGLCDVVFGLVFSRLRYRDDQQ